MARTRYNVGNLSYRDDTRKEDYLLEREEGKSTFYFPKDVVDYGFVTAGNHTEFSCESNLKDRITDQYTKQELNNVLDDFKFDMIEYIKEILTRR